MTNKQTRSARPVATEGSGNVFEDLGFKNADELQAKAELGRQIYTILKNRKLTQREAAKVLGIAQPDVSALMKGRHTGFSLTRLMTLLGRLDRDVEIIIRRKPKSRQASRLQVRAA